MGANIVAGLISAGASMMGGQMGQISQNRARRAQEKLARENLAQQREFAQHGIRWKVEDAKQAGISPLAALGANTTSFSPIQTQSFPDSPMGKSLANAGQNIGRAVAAQKTKNELRAEELQLQRLETENKISSVELQQRYNDLYSDTSGPTMPEVGVNSLGILEQDIGDRGTGLEFKKKGMHASEKLGLEVGKEPFSRTVHTPEGYAMEMPTAQVTEALENDIVERFRYAGKKLWRIGTANYYHKHPQAKSIKKWMNDVRRVRPLAPKGYEYRLARNGLFKLHKKAHPMDSRFFAVPPTVYRAGRSYKTWFKN